jgi:membrane-associated protease RseP (regulator of RpoE activity)
MSYLGMLLLLSLLIVIHEAGHLCAAKLAGIPVSGFSVGFGPKLWKRRWGQVEYSLRLLPLGGFVKPAADLDELSAIPLARRIAFFVGGPLANLAAAFAIFSIANGVQRGWTFHHLFIAPFGQVTAACWQLLTILPGLFTQPDALLGPMGIVVEGARAAQAGVLPALAMALSLNLSLAVLNLLPIPILDGGQITLAVLERIFPPFVRLRVPLTLLGMLLLVGVMIYASVGDVARLVA